MKRQVVYFLTGVVITVLFVAFALGSDGTLRPLAQISPLPTSTFTALPPMATTTSIPSTPTSTSIPPTSTSAPILHTPTSTPVPHTSTDTEPPVSRVRRQRRKHFTRSFRVRLKGRDPGGSGIMCYDVQYKDGSGPWQDWKICTTATSARFYGEWWHRYFFRARAIDNAGNVEAWPLEPDTWTYVLRKN